MTAAADHCHELVRTGSKDYYLASLFAPDAKRALLLALYAFDLEVARIPGAVSEPQIGLIRQQWWLDTLDGIYGGDVPAHPVAQELARAVATARLPQHGLRDLVLARAFDLETEPMPDLEALETYLGRTTSALMQMAAVILAGETARQSAAAAGLAGVSYGLSLRVYDQPPRLLPPGMDRAAAIGHARRRLAEARALRDTIPVTALPAFLPASLTDLYLRSPEPSQFRRQVRMWWAARRNNF